MKVDELKTEGVFYKYDDGYNQRFMLYMGPGENNCYKFYDFGIMDEIEYAENSIASLYESTDLLEFVALLYQKKSENLMRLSEINKALEKNSREADCIHVYLSHAEETFNKVVNERFGHE